MTDTFDFNAFSEKFKDLATKNPIAFTEEYHKQYELWELQQKKKKQEETQTKHIVTGKQIGRAHV